MAAEFPFARLTSNQLTCSERDEAYRRLHAVNSGIQRRLQRLLSNQDRQWWKLQLAVDVFLRELHSRAPHAQLVASTRSPRFRPADLCSAERISLSGEVIEVST